MEQSSSPSRKRKRKNASHRTIYMTVDAKNEAINDILYKVKRKLFWIIGREEGTFYIYFQTKRHYSSAELNKDFPNATFIKTKKSLEDHFNFCLKCEEIRTNITHFQSRQKLETIEENQLCTWQKECIELLKNQTDLEMLWYVCKTDKDKKDSIATAMYILKNFEAIYLQNSFFNNIHAALNDCPNNEFIVFDFILNLRNNINYHAIDIAKTGVFCSRTQRFDFVKMKNHQKIIVLACFPPDVVKFSSHNWKIIDLTLYN